MNTTLNTDGQHFYQYQCNKQPPLSQLIELKETASYADNIQDFIFNPFIMYFFLFLDQKTHSDIYNNYEG